MREYELIIDEALRKGISPKLEMPSNSQFLSEALGFRIGEAGVEIFRPGENPLPATVDMYYEWPFPQFLVGEGYNILVVREPGNVDRLYTVSDDMNTVTFIASITNLMYGTGTVFEMADFGNYAMLVNGVSRVYRNVAGAWTQGAAEATIPLMRTICNFKGQAVGGGVTSVWHDCDEKYYIWSKIGEMDFTPDLRNEAGYRRCPFGGDVYHVRRLGDQVIGYSSKGITSIFPVGSPAATFGFKELIDVGVRNRGAVGGNLFRQIYVGTDLEIRQVTSEGVKKLGYKYLMDDIDNEDIIVQYDPKEGDFYIGNSQRTFLLSAQGMTEIKQHPSAIWRINEDNVYMIPDAEDVVDSEICSEVFDMGYRGQKTISTMETDAYLTGDITAAVDYAFDINTFGTSPYFPINNVGIASINVAGNMFRFRLRFDENYSGFRLSYIRARYKMTDLRGVRGVYAPPLRGQS